MNMNLIEQIQATPKWKEFKEWYNEKFYTYGSIPFEGWYCGGDPQCGFVDLNINFQKGVFEKFIESREGMFEQEHTGSGYRYSIWDVEEGYDEFKSFEQLLIWYFNN